MILALRGYFRKYIENSKKAGKGMGITKKILIADEESFSRVCSAILEFEGYSIDVAGNVGRSSPDLHERDIGLVITSYPDGGHFIDTARQNNIPLIILSDQLNGDVVNMLGCAPNTYCMIKPLNYQKFRTLVRDVLSGEQVVRDGLNIL